MERTIAAALEGALRTCLIWCAMSILIFIPNHIPKSVIGQVIYGGT
jgi:hypothetical protein